jgi:phage terminase large subunit-like protein
VREADRACAFLETFCRHSKGEWAGQLLRLAPWQRAWMRRLFGWRRADGTRRYRRSHVWIPKKNGKSTTMAGVGLFLTVADNEPGAEVYAAASNKDQAQLVFGEARNMTMSSPGLAGQTELFKDSVFFPTNGSRFQVLSAKPTTKHGFNVHGLIVDEIHAHASADLYEVLAAGAGTRRQPLELVISTAGDDIGHFSYELWEYAKKCVQGVMDDPEFLPIVYGADEEDDWRSEKVWAAANPNYGVSVKPDFLRGELKKTEGMPGRESRFRQLYLNVWSQSTKAALSLAKWRECLSKKGPLRLADYAGRRCWAGLDLSKTTDLTALALVFDNELPPLDPDAPPSKRPPEFDVMVFFWVPAENAAERAKRDRVQYPLWIKQGFIRATPGDIVDLRRIRADLREILSAVHLQELAYDPYRAAALAQELQDEEGMPVLEFKQSYTNFTGPCEDLERLHVSRGLLIDPNPVLTWQASNVIWRTGPSGNKMPDKAKSRERIDGITALLMALGRASVGRGQTSVYETRGIEVL